MTHITVYSLPACVQCTATVRHLDRLGIAYEVVNLDGDDDAREFVRGLGHLAAPVVVVSDAAGHVVRSWSGFQPGALAALRTAA